MPDISAFSSYKTPNTFRNPVLEEVMAVSDNEVKMGDVKVIKHSVYSRAGPSLSPLAHLDVSFSQR